MTDERDHSLTPGLTSFFVSVRLRLWQLCDVGSRRTANLLSRLSKSERIVLKLAVASSLAFFFVYSWTHSGPAEYFAGGKRVIPRTLLLGLVLLSALLSLVSELIGKE